MQLQIFKLESQDDNALTTFSTGLHKVGRGPLLQCHDNRISREHAAIEVTSTEAKLTSLHMNPCFLKEANSKTITILSKDKTTDLHDGDKFAFLPDLFWFRVKFNNDFPIEIKQEELLITESGKRHLTDSNDSSPEKRIKREEPDYNYNGITDILLEEVNFEPFLSQIKIEEENKEQEQSNSNGPMVEQVETGLTHEIEVKTEVTEIPEMTPTTTPQEEKVTNEGGKASGSNIDQKIKPDTNGPSTSSRRDRCWYVPNCYRKNAQHKTDFSHPGDADYDSDPSDTRPVCQYGANCYRTNIFHRQHFKHPPGKPPGSKIRNRTKKNDGSASSSSCNFDNNGDEEEEEQEDPFFCDDDSDEYEALTSSSDSDWDDDSENVNENESEENDRLLKEAKRFVEKK